MSEFFRIRKNEGYGGCDDAPAVWIASAISVAVGLTAAKLMGRIWPGGPVEAQRSGFDGGSKSKGTNAVFAVRRKRN